MDKVLTNKQTEKLEINVGHDVTLELILNALGYEVRTSQPYSSLLFFELRIDDVTNQAYVNTIYNHTPLTYGLCTEVNCPIEIFKENIVNRVQNGNIYEIWEEPMMLKGVEDINPS